MDILSRWAPTYEEVGRARGGRWDRIRFDRDYPVCGNYSLCEQVPSGPDDQCYYAVARGLTGFTKPCFLRRFPVARLDEPLIDALKQRARLEEPGIEQLFDIGTAGEWARMVSELIEGLSLAQLQDLLDRQGRTLPWPVVLALISDASRRLALLHGAGCRHGALTPARVRLALRGQLHLCLGVPPPWHPPPPTPAQRQADHRALLGVALSLGLSPGERAPVRGILFTDDPAALAVLGDHLLERHPVSAEPLLAVTRCLSPAAPDAEERRPAVDDVAALVINELAGEDVRDLWRLVLDHSPDIHGGYRPLGDPRR